MKPNALPKQGLKTDPARADNLLARTRQQLQPITETPLLDALVLLAHITHTDKTTLLAHPDPELTADENHQLSTALDELEQGTPLPYVLGKWEFYGRCFLMNPQVLIPRPESEGLVERVLAWSIENPGPRVGLEPGTGSGCIAISLALDLPDLKIAATDLSYPALTLARQNAINHQVENRIRFIQADLMGGLALKIDFLVANLPYIPSSKLAGLTGIAGEPRLALNGGPDGLTLIRQALMQGKAWMKPGGLLALEIDEGCGETARQLAGEIYPGGDVNIEQDLAGLDRYLVVKL